MFASRESSDIFVEPHSFVGGNEWWKLTPS